MSKKKAAVKVNVEKPEAQGALPRLSDADRIAWLEQRVGALITDLHGVDKRLEKTKTATFVIGRNAELALNLCNGTQLAAATRDAQSIHELYRATYLKMTVATEAVFFAKIGADGMRYAPEIALAAVLAFDLPNAWWMKREGRPLEYWVRTFAKIARSGLPEIVDTSGAAAPQLADEAA